jgi:radical SAM protein with 4Fe4S-binding SPASM domain
MGKGPTKAFYKSLNKNYVKGSLTCLKPEVIKKRINCDFPLVLNVEPTNACNAQCYYCPRQRTVAQEGTNHLSLADFKKIIDQVGNHRLIMLNLHKDGESLLHPDLPQMVSYAKEKEAAEIIHMNSNGIAINGPIGRGVIAAGIDDLTISIDAAFEETYNRLKKVKGLKRLEENVKRAIDFRDKIGSRTNIRVKIMEFDGVSTEEIMLFRERWKDVADEVQVTGVHNWSGAIDDISITDEQSVYRYPCGLLWYMLAINSNGKVSICNVDWNYSGVIGSIHLETINEIWNSPRLSKIRRNHLNGVWNDPNICLECVVWVSVGDMQHYFSQHPEFTQR